MIMNKTGAVAKDLEAIKNSFNYPNICHYIKYDDLVSQSEKEIKKIYDFIKEPYYPHYFENLKQINIRFKNLLSFNLLISFNLTTKYRAIGSKVIQDNIC